MWQYLSYSSQYFNNMLEMTRKYYGNIEIADHDYLQHQYFNNPCGDAAIELAYDFENDRLAGQYVAIPNRISVEGKIYPILLSLNTLTDDLYRGQGIFTKLAERLYLRQTSNFIGVYGMPNQNSYPSFIKKLKCQDFGTIPLYLRPLRLSNLVLEHFHNSILSISAKPFNLLYKIKSIQLPQNLKIIEIDQNNLFLIDEFWDRVKKKYPVMLVRDSKYIKWRYVDMPIRKYRICILLNLGIPSAFIVGRTTSVADMNCGMLVDLLTLPGEEKSGKYLVQEMMSYFVEQKVDISGCLMKRETTEAFLLKNCGFFICPKFLDPQPFPMILRLFHENMKQTKVNNFKSWFFTMGDYDVI